MQVSITAPSPPHRYGATGAAVQQLESVRALIASLITPRTSDCLSHQQLESVRALIASLITPRTSDCLSHQQLESVRALSSGADEH